MNFDLPVPNPELNSVFEAIGVAGRFAGRRFFYIQAVARFCAHGGLSRLALKMGGQNPIYANSVHLRLEVAHGTVTETQSRYGMLDCG